MRIAAFGVVALLISSTVAAQVHVRGYTRKDGTYVAPYERTAPDSSIYNNYSTYPNVNPYTGKVGTVNPYTPSTIYNPQPQSSYGYQPATPRCYFNCPK
jgi:hypothetical protein